MWGMRQGLSMVLLGLLAAAAWWLLEDGPDEPDVPPIARARTPDYVVSRLDAVETDEGGRPSRLMVARQLRQYVDEDLAELDQPRLTIIQDDAPPWLAESSRGLLLSGGDEVRLDEDVRLHRAAAPSGPAVLLTTSELTIWPKRKYAQGDRPVRIDSDGDWVTAEGMRLWYSLPRHAELEGRVHMFIAPEPDQDTRKEEHPE